MQVAAADTYEDYVVCRGFEPRLRRFIDYEAGNDDKLGISVAKPYGNRVTGAYEIGEVYPVFLPTQIVDGYIPPSPADVDWRIGQNPGTAADPHDGGHPQALAEAIEEMTDHNGKSVNWLLFGGQKKQLCRFTLDEALATSDADAEATIVTQYGSGANHATTDITVENLLTSVTGVYVFSGASGKAGLAFYSGSGSTWPIIQMECP